MQPKDIPRSDSPMEPFLGADQTTLSPFDGISALPEELLDIILHYVKDESSPAAFWSCLRTCRQWHRIGLGTYGGLDYAVATIVESNTRRYQIHQEDAQSTIHLATDFNLRPPSREFLYQLRSLTVHVQHARNASPFIPDSGTDFFSSLAGGLPRMRRLSTFSLKFADDGWDFPSLDVPAVPQSKLAGLVEALPNTVRNLELDTAGCDVPPGDLILGGDGSTHLCHQINKIILRLQHLRLRVGHVCETFLAYTASTGSCQLGKECQYCACGERQLCRLWHSWNMRGLTVWLPWDQTGDNNAFARISQVLLKDPQTRGPVVLIVQQIDQEEPDRTNIIEPSNPFRDFCWVIDTNVPDSAGEVLRYSFKEVSAAWRNHHISGFSNQIRGFPSEAQSLPCEEHLALTCSPHRDFEFGTPGRGPECPFPYMSEWALEHIRRWAQQGHLGCRYPVAEGDAPDKPFWKAVQFSNRPVPPQYMYLKDDCGLWACLFPKCSTRLSTFLRLRGHQVYAHPPRPHNENTYYGNYPCPSAGCERVGLSGFATKAELDKHLLGHHLKSCTMEPRLDETL